MLGNGVRRSNTGERVERVGARALLASLVDPFALGTTSNFQHTGMGSFSQERGLLSIPGGRCHLLRRVLCFGKGWFLSLALTRQRVERVAGNRFAFSSRPAG